MSTNSAHAYGTGFEPAESWEGLKYNLRVLLDFACGSNHTTNVDQSQIDIAARLILLDKPTGDKDWADAYKIIDYLTRIIGPATLEGIAIEDEARRQEVGAGFRISLPALVGRRRTATQPYLHAHRMETMRFCILTLLLLMVAIYAHSKIIPAQELLLGIESQSRENLKLVEKIALLEQSVVANGPADRGVTVAAAAADGSQSLLRSQAQIRIDAMQSEQRDRGVDVCFRHAYLKAWYLNHGLSSLPSWLPFNQTCEINESDVLAACTGGATSIACRGSNVEFTPDPASASASIATPLLEQIKPAAMPAQLPNRSLEQVNEHIIRSHVDTIVRIWLPALYGALGACLWVIRERYAQIREVRVSRTRVVSRTSRLMLGAGMGSVVHMFQPILPEGYEAISLPAIAFVVGYNVEFVFALADEFIKRFAGNQPAR